MEITLKVKLEPDHLITITMLLPNPDIVASVIVVIAVAVVAAIVIVILIRIGILQKKTPTQPTTDGLGE